MTKFYNEILSLYPIRWSRDLYLGGHVTSSTMNKMYTALLSLFVGQLFMRHERERSEASSNLINGASANVSNQLEFTPHAFLIVSTRKPVLDRAIRAFFYVETPR